MPKIRLTMAEEAAIRSDDPDPAALRRLFERFPESTERSELLARLDVLEAQREATPPGFWTDPALREVQVDVRARAERLRDAECPPFFDYLATSVLGQLATSALPPIGQIHTAVGGYRSWTHSRYIADKLQTALQEAAMNKRLADSLRHRLKVAQAQLAAAGMDEPVVTEVEVQVPVPFIIGHTAKGSFDIQVVNKRRAAEGRAKGWSATLRGLEADRQRRLLDPTATDGPGTDAWKALMAQIIEAREGFRNAATELWDKPAADSLVDQKVAGALPWVAASARRTTATAPTSPVPLGPPAPEPTAPLALAPTSPTAPPPLDVAAICQAYQEGLTAGLGVSY